MLQNGTYIALSIIVILCPPFVNPQSLEAINSSKTGIRWRNLAVTITDRTPEPHFLLHPSNGFVEKGKLCAILGPSGAGKSTLLAALSGTTLKSHGKQVWGAVWYEENHPHTNTNQLEKSYTQVHKATLSMSKGEIAFLPQHDDFFSMLTPKETVELASYLQLASTSKTKRMALSRQIIEALGLNHVQTRRIGGGGRGLFPGASLSGGERRRLSVALELVTNPKVFFADEPTTGLDSGQAQNVIRLMKKLAQEQNIPYILTLHQPRASIWKMLDSFILMAPGGKIVYMGARDQAIPYFQQLGLPIPADTNPAEFFIDLVTVDVEDHLQASIDMDRINHLADAFCAYNKAQEKVSEPPNTKILMDKRIVTQPFLFRFLTLLRRSLRQNLRDFRVNLLRLVSSIGLAGLFSELFKSVKSENWAAGVADRVALLSYGVISMTMMSLTKTLNLFGNEKPVVMREQMRKQYTSFDYLLSKVVAELPIDVTFSTIFSICLKYAAKLRSPLHLLSGVFTLLTVASASLGFAIGSLTSNVEEAMTLGMPLMVILMTVGVINPSGVSKDTGENPLVLFLRRFSPIRYAIEALSISEFRGMDFGVKGKESRWRRLLDLPRMGGLALVRSGDDVLDALGLGNARYQDAIKQLAILSGANLLISLLGLSFFGPEHIQAKDDGNHKCKEDTAKSACSSKTLPLRYMPQVKII